MEVSTDDVQTQTTATVTTDGGIYAVEYRGKTYHKPSEARDDDLSWLGDLMDDLAKNHGLTHVQVDRKAAARGHGHAKFEGRPNAMRRLIASAARAGLAVGTGDSLTIPAYNPNLPPPSPYPGNRKQRRARMAAARKQR